MIQYNGGLSLGRGNTKKNEAKSHNTPHLMTEETHRQKKWRCSSAIKIFSHICGKKVEKEDETQPEYIRKRRYYLESDQTNPVIEKESYYSRRSESQTKYKTEPEYVEDRSVDSRLEYEKYEVSEPIPMRTILSESKAKLLHGSSQFDYNRRNSYVRINPDYSRRQKTKRDSKTQLYEDEQQIKQNSKQEPNTDQENSGRQQTERYSKSQGTQDEVHTRSVSVQGPDNQSECECDHDQQSTYIKYNSYRRLQSTQPEMDQEQHHSMQQTNAPRRRSAIYPRDDKEEDNYNHNGRRRESANYHRNCQKLDIIIFGATGSLGSYTVLSAANVLCHYKWGVAGRDRNRLEDMVRNVEAMTNKKLSSIPIYIVDADNQSALETMAKDCQVLINCCGPYSSTANAVIGACINSGTHYVDACMEPAVLKNVREIFNAQAEKQHIYIINSCGFFSFAIDVGINYLEDIFEGDVYEVEAYTQFCVNNGQVNTPITSFTAFQGFISAFATAKETLTKKFQCGCVANVPKVSYGVPIKKNQDNSGVSIPMPFIETQTVHQTQIYLHEKERKPPMQFRNYLTFPSYLAAILALIWFAILFVISQAPRSREFLVIYPKFFSLGLCTNDCLPKATMENLMFSVTLVAHGWKDPNQRTQMLAQCNCHPPNTNNSVIPTQTTTTTRDSTMQRKEINKEVRAKISGHNPIYGFGCIALLSSAIIILRDARNLPECGGVYTPGAAFRNTDVLGEVANHEKKYRYREI